MRDDWTDAKRWMCGELAALEIRLAKLPTFSASVPMVHDAIPSRDALELADAAIERSRRILSASVAEFLARADAAPPAARRDLRARYVALRWQANALLETFDVFADAITQRAEHGVGVLLKGLDTLARDGLRCSLFDPPPIVVFADRGPGGEVRRAFTRLPDGGRNAIMMVRLPRERLYGVGLASLLHEVGHQAVALLGMLPTYRRILMDASARNRIDPVAAAYWTAKLGELLPDLWACGKLGVAASLGLMSVFSGLPRAYVDRATAPHPAAWIRVLASLGFGAEVMPDPIWNELRARWLAIYPIADAPVAQRGLLETLAASVPHVMTVLAHAAPRELDRRTLPDVLETARVDPARLRPRLQFCDTSPCVTLARLGLARHTGALASNREHDVYRAAVASWASLPDTDQQRRAS